MVTILELIDQEIEKLQRVRSLLSKSSGAAFFTTVANALPKNRGRKPGLPIEKAPAKKAAKRVMSAQARENIAVAQRKRWAATKSVAKTFSAKGPLKSEAPF